MRDVWIILAAVVLLCSGLFLIHVLSVASDGVNKNPKVAQEVQCEDCRCSSQEIRAKMDREGAKAEFNEHENRMRKIDSDLNTDKKGTLESEMKERGLY